MELLLEVTDFSEKRYHTSNFCLEVECSVVALEKAVVILAYCHIA